MKRFFTIIFVTSLLWCCYSCNDLLLGEPEPNTVLNNFDVFGKDFQERYGLFEVRQVNWPMLLEKYRAPLAANPTEENLFEALTGLIDELNDSHVSLSHPTGDFPSYEGGIWGQLDRAGFKDFDFELVRENYLDLIEGFTETIYYGKLPDNIGYIYLPEIKDEPEFYINYIPKVIKDLRDTDGLVIDVRNNDGGEDEGGRTLAGFFTDKKVHYMVSKYKTGPGANDFEKPRNWYVDPAEGERYLKPIVLLTNRYSISAAETFAFAMKSFPHVVQMGDTTSGAFSDAISRQLPNGWGYTLSIGDYRNANGESFEGIGLAPDVLVENTVDELESGVDKTLETAIAQLRK